MTTTNTLALYPIDGILKAAGAKGDPIKWAYAHSIFPCSGLFYIPEIGYAFDLKGLQFEARRKALDMQIPLNCLQVLYVPEEQAQKVEKPLDLYGLQSPYSEPVRNPELDRAAASWAANTSAAGSVLTALEAAQRAQERRLDEIEAGLEKLTARPTAPQQAALVVAYPPAIRGAIPSDWYDMKPSNQQWLLERLLEVGETQVRLPVLWEEWEARVVEVAEGPAPGMAARSGTEWLRLFGVDAGI